MSTDTQSHQAVPQKCKHHEFQEHDDSSPENPISKPTTSITASRGMTAASHDVQNICARCEGIDLEEIFNTDVTADYGRGKFIVRLLEEDIASSGCLLCKLFASMAPLDIPDGMDDGYDVGLQLRAFSAGRVFCGFQDGFYDRRDQILLGVVRFCLPGAQTERFDAKERMTQSLRKTGYLCSQRVSGPNEPQEKYVRVRTIRPDQFDVGFARDCISFCEENHGSACNQSRNDPGTSLFFRVIDCKTGRIITAPPNCSYAAVSYVWGALPAHHAVDENNKQRAILNCPKVIKDSIEVALKLDILYIWVDRYCIDQSNAQDIHDQVRKMDVIYANAVVTIIAGQAEVHENGIPGVLDTPRKKQPSYTAKGLVISSTLPDSQFSVGKSKWATRGWTYQEGVLSKRRLIFTDEQLFFECNGMHCCESMEWPLDLMHDKETGTFKKHIIQGPLGSKTPGSDPYEIMKYISEFNRRELTFVEDKINAMRGILHGFQESPMPVYQLMGVPMMPSVCRDRSGSFDGDYFDLPHPRSLAEGFLIGLTWGHDTGLSHTKTGRRITHFPSWSWAGWTGDLATSLFFERHLLRGETRLDDSQVWIEKEDGDLSPFPTYDAVTEFESMDPYNKVKFIHVEVNTFRCSTVPWDENQSIARENNLKYTAGRYYAKVEVQDDFHLFLQIELDRPLAAEEKASVPLVALMIGGKQGILKWNPYVLIFVQESEGYFERLGIGYNHTILVKSDDLSYVYDRENQIFSESMKPFISRRKIRLG